MTNPNSQTALAEPGSPKEHNMAEIIDSLKRLERIGSDDSQVTRKMLDAAREIESRICEQYHFADRDAYTHIAEYNHHRYSLRYGRNEASGAIYLGDDR